MSYRTLELGTLVKLDPTEASRRILNAYGETQACLLDAAQRLGCDARTLRRWIRRLRLERRLEAVSRRAERQGWKHDRNRRGGRKPRLKDRGDLQQLESYETIPTE